MKTSDWPTLVILCQLTYLHMITASDPYFFLYSTSCAPNVARDFECCGNAPINPFSLEIDFLTIPSDDVNKPWQLDAMITWTPLTTDYLEYAVRFQPVVTPEELNSYETGFLSQDRRFCVLEDEVVSNNCSSEPFFDIVTNYTSLYVEDLLYGFPYKLEIQAIVNGTAQLKYYCFNSCYDIFPKTVAPDCFQETQDEAFCKNYPVPLSGSPSNVKIDAECLAPDDVGWTVDITWDAPVNVNGEATHYAITILQFTTLMGPPYSAVYFIDNTTGLARIVNGSYTYTIRPFDEFHRGKALLSEQQYAIVAYVRLPEPYNVTGYLFPAGRANLVLRTFESDWCPTTRKMTTMASTSTRTSVKMDEVTSQRTTTKTTTGVSQGQGAIPNSTVIVAVSVIAVLLLCVFLVLIYRSCCGQSKNTIIGRQDTKFFPRKQRENNYSFKGEPTVPIEFKGKEVLNRSNIEVEVEPLGRGQYGDVYKGTLVGLKEKGEKTIVAIKTPKTDASIALKEDFLDEIKLMIEIGNHPHIMPIFGCCTLSEPFYLITEYMKYGALDQFLLRCRMRETADIDKTYNIREINQVQIAWQISKGMSYLATTKYFHGDLAARNCLVGDNLLIKVSDFGLSDDIYQRGYKRIAPEKKRPVKWYSPEANFDGVCSTKGDVWSFGVVMWEIYTLGGIPYPGMPASEVVGRTKAGYTMPQPEGCPVDIYKIMAECWQGSPKDRPNFSEIEYALEVILAHRAEVNLGSQQTTGDIKEAPYLPMTDNDSSKMVRRDSSLADKINLNEILGTSADSAFQSEDGNTSAASFTTDYQLVSGGVIKVEPIIEEDDVPRDRRDSIDSFQSNPDLVRQGSADSFSFETFSEGAMDEDVR